MARLKPLPRSQRKLVGALRADIRGDRGNIISRRDDKVKDISVGLMDIDAAIMYYFSDVIKPTVVENGEVVKVPIMYANPERWKTIQRDGHIRDSKKQLITPLIAFRRTSLAKDDTIAVDKMNAEDPQLSYTFERKYTQENRYDKFSVLQGKKPSQEFYTVAMPDYMTLTYECIIWTSYIEQMNKIVETINWSEGSYWGEPGKFKFRVAIDSFDDATEMAETERMIKTNFSFSFRGYLVPKSFNNYSTTNKYFSPKTLKVIDESGGWASSVFAPDTKAQTVRYSQQKSRPREGLGGASDFIRGIAGQVGNAIEDLEFTNTYGGETMYIMRSSGEPSSSGDNKSVLSLGFADKAYFRKVQYFSGSMSGSTSSTGSQYRPTFDSSMRGKNGTFVVKFNGIDLLNSQTDQTTTGSLSGTSDWYIDEDQKRVNIKTQVVTDGVVYGLSIKSTDDIIISFQQELS